jgi:hypothetical protein
MADSTVPAVKAYLLAEFQNDADLTGVTVKWSAPADGDQYTRDMVWLGDVDQTEVYRAIGQERKDEDYTLEVVVQAYLEGDDPRATEERAWELRAAVAAAIRADLTLGGNLNHWAEMDSTRMTTRPADPKGWLAKGTLQLRCRARI